VSQSKQTLYGLLGLMTFLWSVNYVVSKVALRHFSPMLFTPMRTVIAAALLILVWRHAGFAPIGPEWRRIAFLGIIGITGNQLAFMFGMARTSVAHASLIIALTPVLVLLLSAWRAHEPLTARKVAGMTIAFSGVALLNFAPSRSAQGATPLGDFLVFLASFTFSVFTVAGRNITRRLGAIPVTAAAYIASAISLIPLGLWQARGVDFTRIAPAGWLTLLYMAVFPSVVCYLIYYHALSRIPASRVAAFSYSQPLIATLTGFFALGEPVTVAVALAGMLVLSGVWVTSRG
jgi:drug/metabolite transporter (DMT)-like permease